MNRTRGGKSNVGMSLSDVAEWADEFGKERDAFVRWTFTRGVAPRELRLTAQAYTIREGRVVVLGEEYGVWPTRSAKTVEGLMLSVLLKLEHATERRIIGACATVAEPPGA